MSDPISNDYVPPPPPPPLTEAAVAPRNTKLRMPAIVLAVLGVLIAIGGIAKLIPGGVATGAAFVFFGIVLFALSFIRLPAVADSEPEMSTGARLAGIFYEPSRVFRSLRSHPTWLAPFLVIVIATAAYEFAFFQRLTPERIVEYTMEKLQDSPIKPPPEAMDQARENSLQQAKQPIQRAQTAAKRFVTTFCLMAFVAALYLLGVLVFGGRINYWQALAVTFYASMPVVLIQKVISLVILFIKSPDDIHPILGQETLVTDNLGVLFKPGEHPALFVLGTAIGALSIYRIWLTAKGLQNGGTKVSSTAAWGATLTLLVLGLIVGMIFATLFSSFLS